MRSQLTQGPEMPLKSLGFCFFTPGSHKKVLAKQHNLTSISEGLLLCDYCDYCVENRPLSRRLVKLLVGSSK